MMMKEKSHPWARLKYLYVLPLAAISMVAFAHTEAANNSNGISEAKGTEVLANEQTSDEHSNEKFTVHINNAGEYSYGPMGGTLKNGSLDDVANYIQAERKKLTEAGGGQYLAVNVKLDNNAPKESFEKLKETLRKINVLNINYAPIEDATDEVFMVVEEMPEYPGGIEELMKYLQQNVKYPVKAQQEGVQGRVIVQFVVGKDGKLRDFNVLKSVSPEMDAEAIRVCKAMPAWKPGKQRGKTVSVKFTIPIVFRLNIPETENKEKGTSPAMKNNKPEGGAMPDRDVEKNANGEEVFMVVEKMPVFPGGTEELLKYLQNNIKYPKEAQEKDVQGRVIVQFVVSKTGKVINPTIVRSVSPELDAEAIRVVNNMPMWIPGEQKGEAVNVKFTLPMQFRLHIPESGNKEKGEN